MERWRVDAGRSRRRSNLVDADLATGEGRRRDGGACSAHVLVRTPSVALSRICSNSPLQIKTIQSKQKLRNSITKLGNLPPDNKGCSIFPTPINSIDEDEDD